MRYFFDTELEMLCDRHGFQIDQKYEWLTHKKPSSKTWSVVWVVIKK